MYINSNHIRVVKLIQNISIPNFQLISELIKTSEQNITLYIRDIYKFIFPKSDTFKKNIMLNSIKDHENLIFLLKKEQEITKEERATFIIFNLLLKREVNLSELSDFLSVTRRSLNYDILEVKERFEKSNLDILSLNSKGVKLIGDEDNISRIFQAFLFKIVIELDEIPEKLQKVYLDYLTSKNFSGILKDSKKFISQMKLNKYFHIDTIFATFLLVFCNSQSKEPILKDLKTAEEFHFYFKDSFSSDFSNVFFQAIKDTQFEYFPLKKINILVLFLKLSTGEIFSDDKEASEKSNELKIYLQKKLNLSFNDSREYMFYIGRIAFFCLRGYPVSLKDFNFLSLNIGSTLNDELVEMFLELRKDMENVNFSEILNLYFYLTDIREHKEKSHSNTYLLYKDIPEQMLDIIKNRLNKIYSINLLGFVNINDADIHLETKATDCFAVLEKISYINPKVEIRHLPFPL